MGHPHLDGGTPTSASLQNTSASCGRHLLVAAACGTAPDHSVLSPPNSRRTESSRSFCHRFEAPGKEVSVERDSVKCRERLGFRMGVGPPDRIWSRGGLRHCWWRRMRCHVLMLPLSLLLNSLGIHLTLILMLRAKHTPCQASDLDQQPEIPGPSTREST